MAADSGFVLFFQCSNSTDQRPFPWEGFLPVLATHSTPDPNTSSSSSDGYEAWAIAIAIIAGILLALLLIVVVMFACKKKCDHLSTHHPARLCWLLQMLDQPTRCLRACACVCVCACACVRVRVRVSSAPLHAASRAFHHESKPLTHGSRPAALSLFSLHRLCHCCCPFPHPAACSSFPHPSPHDPRLCCSSRGRASRAASRTSLKFPSTATSASGSRKQSVATAPATVAAPLPKPQQRSDTVELGDGTELSHTTTDGDEPPAQVEPVHETAVDTAVGTPNLYPPLPAEDMTQLPGEELQYVEPQHSSQSQSQLRLSTSQNSQQLSYNPAPALPSSTDGSPDAPLPPQLPPLNRSTDSGKPSAPPPLPPINENGAG